MNEKDIFIKNIIEASGLHGMKEIDLHRNLFSLNNVSSFVYTLKKAFESKNLDWLSCTELVNEDFEEQWTSWHHIDEKYSESWGFKKNQPGCYIYGLFKNPPNNKPANFLSDEVFYIGQSRSTKRNCMLGRKKDFISTVRNDPLCPYGCGTSFIQKIGKEQIDFVYQAYLPLPASKCLERETDLLIDYYKKYNRLPVCNFYRDENRIKKLSSNLNTFLK
jgi:hypothetical protein